MIKPVQQHPIVNQNSMRGCLSRSRGKSKSKIQVAQTPTVPLPIAFLPTLQPTLMTSWGILFNQLVQEGKTSVVYR